MELKVRFDDLNKVEKTMIKDQEDLDKEIESILKEVEKLRGVWQGGDATNFCNNLEAYAKDMKSLTTTLGNFSKFIDSANKGYKDGDEAFANALKGERAKYE